MSWTEERDVHRPGPRVLRDRRYLTNTFGVFLAESSGAHPSPGEGPRPTSGRGTVPSLFTRRAVGSVPTTHKIGRKTLRHKSSNSVVTHTSPLVEINQSEDWCILLGPSKGLRGTDLRWVMV